MLLDIDGIRLVITPGKINNSIHIHYTTHISWPNKYGISRNTREVAKSLKCVVSLNKRDQKNN